MGRSVGSSTNNLSLSIGVTSHGVAGKVKDIYDKMMFGVLYSMVHGNTFSRKFIMLNLIVEFIQLLSFCFRAVFPWQPELTYLGFSLSFFRLPDSLFSYQSYTVIFWLVFVFVWLSMFNAALVGYGFHHEAYRFIWAIRTLRWFTSVLVSVLYIPVVIIFLTSLSCSPGTGLLTSFSSEAVQCWRVDNAVKIVVAVITLIIFTPFAFANCSTYYEHDPTVKFTYGRAHSRFEVLMLGLKSIWTVCFAFGETIPWLLSLSMVVGISVALMTSLLYMPMYHQRLNQMKTCSLAVVLWASFSTVVCLAINNPADKTALYFFVAGIIPSFFGGFFLHRWRLASLRKISHAMSSTKPYHDVESQPTKGKVVTWATPVPAFGMLDTAAVEAASHKLHFANEVELVARFVLDEPQTPDTLLRAEAIYRAGIKRFPRSTMVLMQFIIFLMVYKRDTQRGFALLEKLRKRGSGYFDIRFFIFRQDKDRERKVQLEGMGGEKGKFDDFVGYMQYQKLYTQARQGHLEVLKLVQKFWKLLLEDEVDMSRLANQAGKIATAESKTEKVYLMLLNLYPQSPRLLRDFAQFVDDILQEEDLVRFLVERADYFEETASKSRSKSPRRKARLNDDDEDEEEEKERKIEDELFEDKSMVSSADLSQSSIQRKKMAMLNKNDNSSLKILSVVLVGCTLISIMLAMTMVVTTTNQIDQYNHDLNRVVSVSLMSTLGAQLAVDARLVAAHARALDVNYTYKKDQDSLLRRSVIYKNMLQAVAWGQSDLVPFTPDKFKLVSGLTDTSIDIGKRVFAYKEYNISATAAATNNAPEIRSLLYDPTLDIVITSVDPHGGQVQQSYKWGFWAAGRLFAEHAQVVGSYTYEKMQNIAETDEEYNYVVLNGGTGIAEGLTRLVDAFTTVATDGLAEVLTITFVNYAVAAFVTIVTGVFVFRPVVLKVVSQKTHTLNLFLKVPPDVVQKMVRRNGQLIKSFKVSLDGPTLVADEEGEFAIEESEDDPTYNNISPSSCKVGEETGIMLTTLHTNQNTDLNESQMVNLGQSTNSNTPLLSKLTSDSSIEQKIKLNKHEGTHEVIVINHGSSSGSSSGSGAGSARMQQRKQNSQSFTRGFIWLHVAYAVGLFFILCCFSALLIAIRFTIDDLNSAGPSINLAASRHRAAKAIGNDLMGFILPETRNISRGLLQRDIDSLLSAEQAVEKLISDMGNSVGMEDLYANDCILEQKSKCTTKQNNPYYGDVSQGLSHLVYAYAAATKRVMTFSDFQLDTTAIYHPDVIWILNMSANDITEGGNRFTRLLSLYWSAKIDSCKQLIGGISGLVIFLFLLEYFAFFRTLLSRLRNESQNTYAMLQMIPKKELAGIRELFELTNNM